MKIITRSAVSPLIIHINRGTIDHNRKHGKRKPPIIVRRGPKRLTYASQLYIVGDSRIVYSPKKPLDCGARVWIEASQVVVQK